MVVMRAGLLAGHVRPDGGAALAFARQLRARPAVPVGRRPGRTLGQAARGTAAARRAAAARVPGRRLRGRRQLTVTDRSAELFARGLEGTPGGVNSPVRAFGSVGGTPRFIERGLGPYLFDVDGRRYVDLVCSWGPMILGHAHPAVVTAVSRAVASGTSVGAAASGEVELAAEILARAPVEQVRL